MARLTVVTGAASGIGRATAAQLRAEGGEVIGIDRADGVEVIADLGSAAGRREAVIAVLERSEGRVDAVIACAGVALAPAETVVSVNHFGVVEVAEGLRGALSAGDDPRAVVVTSLASVHPVLDDVVAACLAGDEPAARAAAAAAAAAGEGAKSYASSKAALARWVRRRAVSDAWAGAGIPLNGVAPGTVVTAMTVALLDDPVARAGVDAVVPMPLAGHAQPEVVAAVLVWLASPANTHVTGQVLFVDGGADAVLRGDSAW